MRHREIPVHYDPGCGWVADVPQPLSPAALQRLAAFVQTVNQQRLAGLPPGDRRALLQTRLAELARTGIQQRLSGSSGIPLVVATEGTGRVFSCRSL